MIRFSDEARRQTAPLRQAIQALPFNAELAAGTLGRERFQHYITQDALYLGQFSRALAIAAAKAPDAGTLQAFAQSALGAVAVERALHEHYLRVFGVDPPHSLRGAGARLSRLYQLSVSHGVSRTLGSAGRGVAALLLDLLGCRLRHRRPGRARKPLPSLDRHLCRPALWRSRAEGCRHRRPGGRTRHSGEFAPACSPPSPAPRNMNGCFGTAPIPSQLAARRLVAERLAAKAVAPALDVANRW